MLGAGRTPVQSLGHGTIDIRLDNGYMLRLRNMHHISNGPNLLSFGPLEASGFRVSWQDFPHPVRILSLANQVMMSFHRGRHGLIASMSLSSDPPVSPSLSPAINFLDDHDSVDPQRTWHLKQGNVNNQYADTVRASQTRFKPSQILRYGIWVKTHGFVHSNAARASWPSPRG